MVRGRWDESDPLPIVRGSVVHARVERWPTGSTMVSKTPWLWWSGPGEPDVGLCRRADLHRLDIEYTCRLVKDALGWTTPARRTPERAQCWTCLVVADSTRLRLARGLVNDKRLPGKRGRLPSRLGPVRVPRGFPRLRAQIGTSAHPAKFYTSGPGHLPGTQNH